MNVSIAATELTKWIAWGPVTVLKIYGRNDGASDLYLQLHQRPVVAANDAPVPGGVLTVPIGQWFDWFFDQGVQLSELTLAMSTAKLLYTAPAAGNGINATAIISTNYAVSDYSGLTVSGDLTTSVANRQVWADSAGPKKLYRLDFVNGGGATSYPYISAADSPATKNRAQNRLEGVGAGLTKSFFFGTGGYSPQEQTQSGTNTLTADGCTIICSASADAATTTLDATTNKSIRAIYA